ncbi:MAG: hypothetical protein H6836_03050 [Planctomycetes bacterium]|nr:hypothetical protein [Planctomycetota bacterium]
MFEFLKTGIDGLDAILGGGIRYPAGSSAFMFATGGAGSGKTMLALEMLTRAWLRGADGQTFLYYSVEHAPRNLCAKLQADFDYFGCTGEITELPQEVPHKICLEARAGTARTRLVLTQAETGGADRLQSGMFRIDVDWILAEIGNYDLGGDVGMVCIDNVGLLLTDLDYYGKRAKLLATRRALMDRQIHGIFVQEETDERDLRLPSAEEFSTDVLLRLSFDQEPGGFKTRVMEIVKARHQYYYRGAHHFSIAGRGIRRDVYLGARNERGPGIHVYPSVAAQLSIARDSAGFKVPSRGNDPIDLGHDDVHAAFAPERRPTERSSTVLLAEPGTRYTYLALRFLTAARRTGQSALMISTKEDREALRRVCAADPALHPCLDEAKTRFHPAFRVLYLHPEFISAGKFAWDILRMARGGHGGGGGVARLVFDNVHRLTNRFPLLDNEQFLIRALVDLVRYEGITPLFIDMAPRGAGVGRVSFDVADYMTTFDNVLHVYLDDRNDDEPKPQIRVLKGMSVESAHAAVPLRY